MSAQQPGNKALFIQRTEHKHRRALSQASALILRDYSAHQNLWVRAKATTTKDTQTSGAVGTATRAQPEQVNQ